MCPVWWGENVPEGHQSVQDLHGQYCMALVRAEGLLTGAKSRDIFDENLIQSTQELRLSQGFPFQEDDDAEHSQEQLCGFYSVAQSDLWLEPSSTFFRRDLIMAIYRRSLLTTQSSSTVIGPNNYVQKYLSLSL